MGMNEPKLNISINPQFKTYFDKNNSEKSLSESIQVSLAISLFVEKKVTLLRAAELSEKTLSDFIKILQKLNIAWMEYTEETMREDEETLDYIRSFETRRERKTQRAQKTL